MDDTFPYPHLDDPRINDVEDKEFEAMTPAERIASMDKMLETVQRFKYGSLYSSPQRDGDEIHDTERDLAMKVIQEQI